MKTQQIEEGKVKLTVPKGYKLDSSMPVFYNTIQVLNRDISIILLNTIQKQNNKPVRILDLLSASGVRGLRIKAEVPNVDVTINDYKKDAYKLMKKNAKLNKLDITIENKPANVLLTELKTYDYLDIDPFGTPVPFLDSAIKRLSPRAIFAVTATDMSALCGAASKACLRKYGSKPLRSEFMHETAVRILIKKCQQTAAQYDVSLNPIFSHSSNHYIRVYFQKANSAKKADDVLQQHGWILYCSGCCWRDTTTTPLKDKDICPKCKAKLDYAGPVWLGELWDQKLVKRMTKYAQKDTFSDKTKKLLNQISEEMSIKSVGFYDMHWLAKKRKSPEICKIDKTIQEIKNNRHKASRTHFRLTGIRTNCDLV
jgi:tRNA (guanine26-N2/guanine27-N2)-dimethyltransferase